MSTFYLGIEAIQTPMDIGVDTSDRVRFSVNFQAHCLGPGSDVEKEIAKLLITNSIFSALGTDIFFGSGAKIPSTGGPYVTIVSSGGFSSLIPRTGTQISRPSFQIITRAPTLDVGRSKAWDIHNLLDGLYNVTLST